MEMSQIQAIKMVPALRYFQYETRVINASTQSLSRRIRVLEENTTLNLDRLAIQLASMDIRFFL